MNSVALCGLRLHGGIERLSVAGVVALDDGLHVDAALQGLISRCGLKPSRRSLPEALAERSEAGSEDIRPAAADLCPGP